MKANYWSSVLTKRQLSRRSILTGAAGLTASGLAMSLVGCGGSSNSSGTGSSHLIGEASDTTSKAVPGGSWPSWKANDVTSLDPHSAADSMAMDEAAFVYSHLLKRGLDQHKTPGAEMISGDAAESWEVTPDAMQVTFKLRQNHKFDPRPPTNGRAMDTEDVVFSWNNYSSRSPFAPALSNARSKDAPISSVTAPDKQTIVMKLASPYGPITEMLSSDFHFFLTPREAGSGFDPRSDMRGSGPWRLTKYQGSLGFEYAKNPDWYVKGQPFLDTMQRTIVQQYATGLSQLVAKNLWDFIVVPEDIIPTKKANPGMSLLQDRNPVTNSPPLEFSQRPDSPFRDARVRRAASMMVDRDLWIDAFFNVESFRKEGLPVDTYWNSHSSASWPSWSDPRGSDLGEGAKYFKHDPAGAKALLSAAGYANKPLESTFTYYTNHNESTKTPKKNEVIANMINEGGLFNLKMVVLDYFGDWRQVCQVSKGTGYDGMCYQNIANLNEDDFYASNYTPDGKYAVSNQPLPGISDLIVKQRTEIDPKKRTDILKEVQRRLAVEMPNMLWPGLGSGFTLGWPWLSNYGVFIQGGSSSSVETRYWYDASKRSG